MKLSSSQRCEIAKYANQHSAANSTAFFEEARETREREHREVYKKAFNT